ncbi:MAG TPA: hypothetical protein PLS95_03335 [Thermoanaerobaculales bacterium]|nr:hypothetical protein [Thermoanaerobaculales bacterium]HQN95165.1 hypothetical protein [Thermoanaerobaculales bacterium]HQP42752.1 hypothetical protein [Thermoanaerobaculales bacterium]
MKIAVAAGSALALALALWAGGAAAASGDVEGQPIVRIVFARYDVFDTSQPETSAWFYRGANSLHIISKESFLRSRLLFKEGEPYSTALAEESARVIRALGFINPVEITARPVEGGVEVTVETHDQWTLEAGGALGLTGSREDWRLEFQEKNFLGLGTKAELQYGSDVEREETVVSYFDPNLGSSWWQTELSYADRSDGFRELARVERPFYSLAVPRAMGGLWDRDDRIDYLYSEGETAVSGPLKIEAGSAWYGFRLPGGRVTRRLTVGFDHRHEEYGEWIDRRTGTPYPTPEDRRIDGPRLSFEHVTDRFEVLHGFRAWSIQEDVALGPNLAAGATFSVPAFGGDIPRLLLDGRFDMAHHRGRWLILGEAMIEGRVDDGDFNNWVAGAWIGAAQLGRRGWQLRLLADVSRDLDLDRQLTLGADLGLRGWDPDYFDGCGRAVANVQWRALLKEDLFQVLALGVEVFADAGSTWDARVGRATGGVRFDAGIGIIGDLTTIGLTNIARIEVGFPDDGTGPTVIVSTSALF